jgi:hypothetical protein
MAHNITEAERERMEKFASTPKYRRGPDLLEPQDGDEVDDRARQ